jgi:putative Holliday junction resolvase
MKTAAIDIGLKRIGIALNLQSDIVLPQNAIIRKNRNQAAKEVSEFLKEWKIDKLIVGIPKSGKSADEMTLRIKHFVSLLSFDKEIEYYDEYGSSLEAKEMIKGEIKQKRDGRIDSLAAKIILERWLFKNGVGDRVGF